MNEMSDDLMLICVLQEFMQQFRSVVAYPDLLGMTQLEFEKRDATEQGRLFEWALGRYVVTRAPRRFRLVTGAGTLDLGLGLTTASGIRHEVDLVLTNGTTLYAFEAKHYLDTEITKDLLAVFNQKTLDFYLELLRRGLATSMKRLFVARTNRFNFKVRQFAWSWGITLIGGDQQHPLWLQHQFHHWVQTRGSTPALLEYVGLADELAPYSFQDFADLVAPFSAKQASLRLDRLLGCDRCEMLVQNHERLNMFWQTQRVLVKN